MNFHNLPPAGAKRLVATLIILVLATTSLSAQNGVYNDIVLSIDNSTVPDTLYVGGNYEFRMWLQNDFIITGISLGFRVYSDNGVSWEWTAQPEGLGSKQAVSIYPDSRFGYPDGWASLDMTGLLVNEQDVDGLSPDTLAITGVAMAAGIANGPLEPQLAFHFSPVEISGDLGTICIDSTFVPPSYPFVFFSSFIDPGSIFYEGPFCWPVKRAPILGDFDLDGQITVGDVVEMIGVIFKGKVHPIPLAAGDVNCDGSFNVGDALYLIAYIFKFGPAPGCP